MVEKEGEVLTSCSGRKDRYLARAMERKPYSRFKGKQERDRDRERIKKQMSLWAAKCQNPV